MIVDGRAIAADILARARLRARALPRPPVVVALSGAETPATRSYLNIKARAAGLAGCAFETRPLGADIADADALIVQLPLPEGSNAQVACDAIPLAKDADVLSRASREKFARGDAGALLPPVVAAVGEILRYGKVAVKRKKVAVVGEGFLVGAPVAAWLRQQGAEVKILTIETKPEDLAAALRAADIIISGAGSPRLIKPDMIKKGVVLIDGGTSELGGKVAGDADPACAAKCSVFTPVPGGVGPVAVAKLFENAVFLTERNLSF